MVCGTSVEALNKEYNILKGSALYNDTVYAAGVIVNIENNNEWAAIIKALQILHTETQFRLVMMVMHPIQRKCHPNQLMHLQ